jgi:predicted acyl esterase
MRRRALLAALALLVGLVPLVGQAAADPPTHATGYIPVAVGTLDEAQLHYKVMLPDKEKYGPGPYPAVIDYSGYIPGLNVYDGLDDRFVAAGYAVVGLNIRGSACSSGKFDYFEPRQNVDGVEALDWLAEQEWSNGRFGMVGKSYPGITQLFVAGAKAIPGDGNRTQEWIDGVLADHLAAIVPGHVFGDLYRDVPYPGGIQNVTFAGGWSAQRAYEGYIAGPQHFAQGKADEQCMRNQAQHAANPPFNPFVQALQPQNNFDSALFRQRSPFWFAEEIDTPMFLIEAWQDEQVGSRATHLLEVVNDDLPWKFLGTNGDHGEYYGAHVFPHILEFLSYYLPAAGPGASGSATAGTPAAEQALAQARAEYEAEPDVIINWEVDEKRTPAWTETYDTWPVPGLTPDRLYATPDGGLTADKPATTGTSDYLYAPEIGSQERGGYDLAGVPAASWDDRPADGTSASFTTAPLSGDKVLLGTASIDLWLSSTAPDTDLEVTLSEVRPDGKEVFIQQGWLRASHRKENPERSTELRPFQTHQALDSQPLVPGTPSLMRVEIFPFGHVFRDGSQVRVTVAAPHVHPDLWGFTAIPTPARNTVHTGGETASSVVLPLVSGAEAKVEALPACGGIRVLRNQPCRDEG